MRTVANDEHQTAAMVTLLSSYGWNWVGIITTDGDYGRSAFDNFVSQASKKGICVAFRSVLPQSDTNLVEAITEAARTISKKPRVKVIVSFAKPSHMNFLFQELRKQALTKGDNAESLRKVWVASDSWSSSGSVLENITLEDIGYIVGFTFKSGNVSSFCEYLSRLEAARHNYTGNNSFLREFYKQSSNNLNVSRDDLHTDSIYSIEMAVNAIAQAVASICRKRNCKTRGAVQPWEVFILEYMCTCVCYRQLGFI